MSSHLLDFEHARDRIAELDEIVQITDRTHRWIVAGSYRRIRSALEADQPVADQTVGSIQIVAIPQFGLAIPQDLLFPEQQNLLFWKLDDLWRANRIRRALYGPDQQVSWGKRMRGVVYNETIFEFYTTTPTSWGKILAMRTGPFEHVMKLLEEMKANGLRHIDGETIDQAGQLVNLPEEQDVYTSAGWPYRPPHERS